MSLPPGRATERLLECCASIARARDITSDDLENGFGQKIAEVRAGAWRLRSSLPGFGLGLAAAIDDHGATLAMIHPAPGTAGDLFDAVHQSRTVDFARIMADRFSERSHLAGACHPLSEAGLARSARDAAVALMGAVVEAMPSSSFASALIQWRPAGCFASIGCDAPIGDPERPAVTDAFERRIIGMKAPLTLREGSAWKTLADQIVPDLQSAARMGVVVVDATVETLVERDALSYLRAVDDGREACARLEIPAGEHLLQPPI